MEKFNFTIVQCQCGGITISSDVDEISMSSETFHREFPGVGLTPDHTTWNGCNYCVNEWGVDLHTTDTVQHLEPTRTLVLQSVFEKTWNALSHKEKS